MLHAMMNNHKRKKTMLLQLFDFGKLYDKTFQQQNAFFKVFVLSN